MSTNLTVRVNVGDPSVVFGATGADYFDLDLANDYLIWTGGSDDVINHMNHEPTNDELNEASTLITDEDTQVPYCYVVDYSGAGGQYTHEVLGIGDNEQYVFCFSFDGATASEPTLEAWDDSNHDSTDKNVLGGLTGYSSFVKAVCTTVSAPGTGWAGLSLSGTNSLELNGGNGAIDLTGLATGDTYDCYANIKIVIPANYPVPAVENFVFTVKYTWN